MDEIKTVKLAGNQKAVIKYADYCFNPREDCSNIGKMTYRPNREYKLPEEISFDFLAYDDWEEEAIERMNELEKDYYVFFIDCYIHWGYAFSLSWEWMQCMRDTAKNAWMICIPKEYCGYDLELWKNSKNQDKWEKITVSQKEAYDIAKQELKERDDYFNGYQYEAEIYVKRTYKCLETWDLKESWEYVESTWVYFDMESLEDELQSEYNEWEELEILDEN